MYERALPSAKKYKQLPLPASLYSVSRKTGKYFPQYSSMNKINDWLVRCWNWVMFCSHFEIIPCTCPSPWSTITRELDTNFKAPAKERARAPVFRPRAEQLRSDPGREHIMCVWVLLGMHAVHALAMLCLLSSGAMCKSGSPARGVPGSCACSADDRRKSRVLMEIALQNDIFNSGQWNRFSKGLYALSKQQYQRREKSFWTFVSFGLEKLCNL